MENDKEADSRSETVLHLVILRARSPLKMTGIGSLAIGGTMLQVHNWTEPSPWSGRPLHLGLEYRARCLASVPRGAFEPATRAAEQASNFLSAAHGVAVSSVGRVISIDIDQQSPRRRFAQVFEDLPGDAHQTRPFSYDALRSLTTAHNAADDRTRKAVDRALWHLRKSAGVDDLVQQFIELWIGLDAVNGLLQVLHNLPNEQTVRRCGNCGQPTVSIGTTTGIKYAVTSLAALPAKLWRTIRETRQSLLHGRPGFDASAHDFPGMTEALRIALVRAVAALLRIGQDQVSPLMGPAMRPTESPTLVVWGTFTHVSLDLLLRQQSLPRLVLDAVIPEGPVEPHPLSTVIDGLTLRFRQVDAGAGCTIEGAELRTFGSRSPLPLPPRIVQ